MFDIFKKPSSSEDPMKVVEKHFDKKGMKYLRPGPTELMSGTLGPLGMVIQIVRHNVDKKSLLFLFLPVQGITQAMGSLSTGSAPLFRVHSNVGHSSEQVSRVCEHLMHKNYKTFLGSFERDQSDGEIRYRIALPYRDTNPTEEQIDWCMDMGIATLSHGIIELNEILGEARTMEI